LLRGGRSLTRITPGTYIADSPNYLSAPPRPRDEPRTKHYAGPEALAWLRENPNESALASNRFGDSVAAIAFVQSLYTAGATSVIINAENIVDEGGGDLYADALVVYLPEDHATYDRVIAICHQEADRETGEITDSSEWQDLTEVFLWWD
jgi:hypothetical protein